MATWDTFISKVKAIKLVKKCSPIFILPSSSKALQLSQIGVFASSALYLTDFFF